MLSRGAPDILAVCVECSLATLTRHSRGPLRDQFGLTPEAVRAQGHLTQLALVEALTMDQSVKHTLAPPRFVDGQPLLPAGHERGTTAA